MYVAKNGENIIQEKYLTQMRALENAIVGRDGWLDFCYTHDPDQDGIDPVCRQPNTPLNYYYGQKSKGRETLWNGKGEELLDPESVTQVMLDSNVVEFFE